MCPIFDHLTITQEHISTHMMDYIKELEVNIHSQKSLIGVMSATRLLLDSELLKWYLLEGREVTKVYKTFRYRPKKILSTFVEQATDARRQGDRDQTLVSHLTSIVEYVHTCTSHFQLSFYTVTYTSPGVRRIGPIVMVNQHSYIWDQLWTYL